MKNFSLLLFLLVFFSCSNNPQNQEAVAEQAETQMTSPPPVEKSPPIKAEVENLDAMLLGSYVGMFNAIKFDEGKRPSWENKINISIDKIEGDKVFGHSVVAGNDRPFEGSIQKADNTYQIVAKEPGDDRYDGVFSFTVYPDDGTIKGNWIANRKNLAVTERGYDLEKRAFEYKPDHSLINIESTDIYGTYNEETNEAEFLTEDVYKKNASADVLTKEDVENMHKSDLEVMRNAIYARHGYSFKNRKMRYVFNYVDWYMPMHTDIRTQLTGLELQNIELLKRYEQHAERYYDGFGR